MADDDLDPVDSPQDFTSRFGNWADQNLDWRTGKLLSQDPVAAIDSMIRRGIPPPDFHAPVRDPSQGNLTDDIGQAPIPFADPDAPPSTQTSPAYTIPPTITEPPLSPTERTFNSDVKRLASQAVPKPAVPLPSSSTDTASSDLDPADVPLPRPRPKEADSGTDLSGKKKPSVTDATSDFAKSLQGVKALQPPPVNPVGTPSVRSPGAISAPAVQNLLLAGQQARANAILPLLGKLLVMGKI